MYDVDYEAQAFAIASGEPLCRPGPTTVRAAIWCVCTWAERSFFGKPSELALPAPNYR